MIKEWGSGELTRMLSQFTWRIAFDTHGLNVGTPVQQQFGHLSNEIVPSCIMQRRTATISNCPVRLIPWPQRQRESELFLYCQPFWQRIVSNPQTHLWR